MYSYLIRTRHLQLVDVFGGHRDECLLWPRQEPVNGAAVDEAWELLSTPGELCPDR